MDKSCELNTGTVVYNPNYVPPGSTLLSSSEVFSLRFKAIKSWDRPLEVLPLRYGKDVATIVTLFSSLLVNHHSRLFFNLFTRAGITYSLVTSVVLPTTLTYEMFNHFVFKKILSGPSNSMLYPDCITCLELRGALIMANIKQYIVNSEENFVFIHPVYTKRVTNLLKFIGFDIGGINNQLPVYDKDSKAEYNDDRYFLPESDDDYLTNFITCKRIGNDYCTVEQDNHCISASKLIAILPHEVECSRSHLVPGWCVAVYSGDHLRKINQYLQSFVPLSEELRHIKRIDSCRSYGNKSTYVFLQIATSRYTWLDANETLASMVDSLRLNSSDHQFINTSPIPCWIPMYSPITRKHQLLYSFSDDVSQEKEISSFTNSLGKPIILGWPCTLRAYPELERLVNVGRNPLLSCFSELELERHSSWLKRVSALSKKAQELSDLHPQSCAGIDGPACAVIIVDPESNSALAESTTPVVTSDTSYLDHAVLLAVSAVAKLKKDMGNQYSNFYLCTNLDAYVSLEPCLMCGMALLHNRIRRVFCCQKLEGNGAFTNTTRLHVREQLNHRFRVFAPP
ncbi:tRNA-specific adenosine deaminase TAD3 [Schistosoma japonicum]|nr:tRNA-specific adenosine deaminase TAD3 [Schistosoma japonicum]